LTDPSVRHSSAASASVGADGGIGDPIDKPKGIRWATFDRRMDQVEAAEAVCNAHLSLFLQKLSWHE